MKKAFILLALIAGVALAWAAPPDRLPSLLTPPAEARTLVVVGGGVPAAGWTEATPNVWGTRCEDNAANTTITAWVGANGAFPSSNSSAQTSTDHYEGTRSFAVAYSNYVAGPASSFPSFSDYTDGTFTYQFAIKATTAFSGDYYVRAFSIRDTVDYSEDIFMAIHGDTQLYWYLGGNEYTLTVNDLSTGAWQVLRVVFSTGTNKIAVYQGADEEHLSLTAARTDAIAFGTVGSTTCYFAVGGDPADNNKHFAVNSALVDDIKVWNTSVTP